MHIGIATRINRECSHDPITGAPALGRYVDSESWNETLGAVLDRETATNKDRPDRSPVARVAESADAPTACHLHFCAGWRLGYGVDGKCYCGFFIFFIGMKNS